MVYYLYLFGKDRHISAREDIFADSDTDAVSQAETYVRQHRLSEVELWLGTRRVMSVGAKTPAS